MSTRASGPALDQIKALSDRERASPARADLSPPPTISPEDVSPAPGLSDPASPTLQTFAKLLPELLAESPAGAALTFPTPTTSAARLRAIQAYSHGRARLLDGDAAGAISELEASTRLDPQAAEPWRELGEAQLVQGKRLSAMVSFQQAVRRGLVEPRTLWALGRDALRSGRPLSAAQYLARARGAQTEPQDPAVPYITNADLAEALAQLGYIKAASEVFDDALELPSQFGSSSRFRNELADLYRRRGELFRDLGDLRAKLNEYDIALAAYSRADELPMIDPGSLLPRQVYALLATGRPASAARALLEQIEKARFADGRAVELCGYLHKHAGLGGTLAAALLEFQGLGDRTPSGTASLDRARALASEPAAAREILRTHLKLYPSDQDAVELVIGLIDRPSAAAIAAEVLFICEAAPTACDSAAEALLSTSSDVDAVRGELRSHARSDAAALLDASILERTGRRREALAAVSGREWAPQTRVVGTRRVLDLLTSVGQFDQARAELEKLKRIAQPDLDASIIAGAALNLQQPEAALGAIGPALRAERVPDPSFVSDLLLAAAASVDLGRGDDAEKHLRRAIEIDPLDERGYAALLRLYSPRNEQADAERLGELARSFRQSLPSARVLRLLAAQEMSQHQLDAQAEKLLRGLVEENKSDSAAGSALVTIWENRAVAARGNTKASAAVTDSVAKSEAWLRELTVSSPEMPWPWTGLARVLNAQGKSEDAERLLASRFALRPITQFGQMREAILRDWLKKPEDALSAAAARLGPTPRGVEESIELTDVLIAQKKITEALGVLRTGLPSDATLSLDQGARLALTLGHLAQAVEAKAITPDAAVAEFFDVASARHVTLPAAIHEFRLKLLASQPTPDNAAITRALAEACAQQRGQTSGFYARIAASHLEAGRGKEALPFLRSAVSTSNSPSPDLLIALVQQTATVGETQDLTLLVEQVTNPQQMTAVLKQLSPDDTPPTDLPALRAQFVYRVSTLYTWFGRTELSTQAKRIALSLNPDLAWAKNDLGYQLLEDDGDFAEATRLIDEAFAALPNEASIIDSAGWLRYHQGILEDRPANADTPPLEGAVTLLRRAVSSGNGRDNATLYDHLGDALWASGQHDEAKAMWTKAEAMSSNEINTLKQSRSTPPVALERADKELASIRAKRRAAAEGGEPPIATKRIRKQAQIVK